MRTVQINNINDTNSTDYSRREFLGRTHPRLSIITDDNTMRVEVPLLCGIQSERVDL